MKFTSIIKAPHLFRRAYAKGKSAAAPTMVLYARKNGQKENRVGFTVSTKIGKAVVRNRVRRRLRECYRLKETTLKAGYDIIVVARSAAYEADFDTLNRHFRSAAKRLDLLAE